MVSPSVEPKMRALFLEPFASSSHLALLDSIEALFPDWEITRHTLADRQWKWRNRTGALQFSQKIPNSEKYDLLLAGSLLNLSDLLALRPNLISARKLIYFHENQFAYPYRKKIAESDKQIIYNNIVSALGADWVLFNSEFNRNGFLDGCQKFLKRIPVEWDLERIHSELEAKSSVFYIPVRTNPDLEAPRNNPPVLLWNHRWEHDKNPELFFEALFDLGNAEVEFKVIVTGEQFPLEPKIFNTAREKLSDRFLNFGFVESRNEYERLLSVADIVVSTARQEFYGISIIEAVAHGAIPVVPDDLSYPELFPEKYRYKADNKGALTRTLKRRISEVHSGDAPGRESMSALVRRYLYAENTDYHRQEFLRFASLESDLVHFAECK
ncbi:MAG: DUF3524 domain-containing protein [candidate division Zixibacteria bacterium]|nr:DUF3524 domain-containing protein [candidate division Zixibacteria bacterium]